MRRVLVFQHVAHEILGTLNPLLKAEGFRIRYINFDRTPDEKPSLDRYNGLVVLGGWMGVYEADRYQHIRVECELIEQALKKEIPILGICLGSQILAHTLGAHVRKHTEREAGWHPIELTNHGAQDPLLAHFQNKETVFQMHGDTFDIPSGALHLAKSDVCEGQAFRYGDKAYGLQFHLEVDRAMIERFLRVPENRREMEELNGKHVMDKMEEDTKHHLHRSVELSQRTFSEFVKLFGLPDRSLPNRGAHGKVRD